MNKTSSAALALGLIAVARYTDYVFLIIALLFALVLLSAKQQFENKVVMVGYVLWVVSYAYQMRNIFSQGGMSPWPIAAGGYYMQYEAIVSFTSLYDSVSKHEYTTPYHVRIGHRFFLLFDFALCMLTVAYGTGSQMDEFGLFPTETVGQRAAALAAWSVLSFMVTLLTLRIGDPRQAKYWCYAVHLVMHALIVRLPMSLLDGGFQLKLQIFANCCFAARFTSPTLPEPANLYRAIMFAMPVLSAAMTPFPESFLGDGSRFLVSEWDMYTVRSASTAWLGGIWLLVIASNNSLGRRNRLGMESSFAKMHENVANRLIPAQIADVSFPNCVE